MRAWGLAGLFLILGAPAAAASGGAEACQFDEQRRRTEQAAPAAPPAPEPERSALGAQRAANAEQSPRTATTRRRNGRRIPDAELIGPRGAL